MDDFQLTAYIIDDDRAVLQSVSELLDAAGIPTLAFTSAEQFLHQLTPATAGCIITDLRMQGMSGADLLRVLSDAGCRLPVVVVSGHADVPVTVEVMENGAVTVLQKPYKAEELLDAVERALDSFRTDQQRFQQLEEIRRRVDSLSSEEYGVMQLMIEGKPNKMIAGELDISIRTVDRRRSTVLEKMGVGSAPEVARMVTLLEALQATVG
ncbi:MAG: response regulator transcription factor [Planctomycetota bacterium]|jgi:FixJ family two-component response regulator